MRLGASTRHLRRLFLEHAGVTPDGLARSSRAHFARRLLDDTDLSVTEIAYASGFGSVRQFNRCMLETFRATPTELRAKRRSTDRLAADGGLCLRIPFVPPLKPLGAGRFLEGWYRDTLAPLYVSHGIGTTAIPARFRCAAELPIFTFRRA